MTRHTVYIIRIFEKCFHKKYISCGADKNKQNDIFFSKKYINNAKGVEQTKCRTCENRHIWICRLFRVLRLPFLFLFCWILDARSAFHSDLYIGLKRVSPDTRALVSRGLFFADGQGVRLLSLISRMTEHFIFYFHFDFSLSRWCAWCARARCIVAAF